MHDWSWQWWLNIQTIPGNIVPDVLIGSLSYIVGRYHVKKHLAPMLERRRLDAERRHEERQKLAQEHHDAALAQAAEHHEAVMAQAAEHHRKLVDHLKGESNG